MHDGFGRGVCVCVCVWPHDNLQNIADSCFALESHLDWGKISDKFACQNHRSWSRLFFGSFTVTWIGYLHFLVRNAYTTHSQYCQYRCTAPNYYGSTMVQKSYHSKKNTMVFWGSILWYYQGKYIMVNILPQNTMVFFTMVYHGNCWCGDLQRATLDEVIYC